MEEEICHHDKFCYCRYKNLKTVRTAKILKPVQKGAPKRAKDMLLEIANLEMFVLMNTKSQPQARSMKI